jgi:hypothetical protein
MRSCEHTKSIPPGRMKRVKMGCFVFWTASQRVLSHTDPRLLHHAQFFTMVLEDQKNGNKMDACTHSCSGHKFLCPVLRWGSAIQRIIATIPDWNEQKTTTRTPNLICATDDFPSSTVGKGRQRTQRQRSHRRSTVFGESVKLCGLKVQASPNFWWGFGVLLVGREASSG